MTVLRNRLIYVNYIFYCLISRNSVSQKPILCAENKLLLCLPLFMFCHFSHSKPIFILKTSINKLRFYEIGQLRLRFSLKNRNSFHFQISRYCHVCSIFWMLLSMNFQSNCIYSGLQLKLYLSYSQNSIMP